MWNYLIASVLFVCTFGLLNAQTESCFQCDSGNDINCIQPDGGLMPQNCARPSGQSCFSRIFDRRVLRGCASDLDEIVRGNCRNETMCELCVGIENCNAARFPLHRSMCHHCEGNVNSTCAGELNTQSTVCEFYEPNDQCFISFDGTTFRRGCVSSSDHCRQPGNCFTCTGIGCNFVEYNSSNSLFQTFSFSFVLILAGIVSKLC